MANNTNSPFVNGNKWRFTNDNQPNRQMTMFQLKKRLEALLSMSANELLPISNDEEIPATIRQSASMILNGESRKVIETINSISNGRKGKKA